MYNTVLNVSELWLEVVSLSQQEEHLLPHMEPVATLDLCQLMQNRFKSV
jgi:hypothetical protein